MDIANTKQYVTPTLVVVSAVVSIGSPCERYPRGLNCGASVEIVSSPANGWFSAPFARAFPRPISPGQATFAG
jgi:hypothetical protein